MQGAVPSIPHNPVTGLAGTCLECEATREQLKALLKRVEGLERVLRDGFKMVTSHVEREAGIRQPNRK